MIKLISNPIKLTEYENWLANKLINPRTNRSIKKDGKIYRYFNNLNINLLYLNETIDNKDPISLNEFWIEKDNNKKIVYENINDLVFYKDSQNIIRCFEKKSIEYMLGYNIKNHPVTGEKLPDYLFENISSKKIIEEKEKTISELALDVFQLFSNISFFIDSNLFLDLTNESLLKLYSEIKDFYGENFTEEQKNNISNNVFKLKKKEYTNIIREEKQRYILENMKILLSVNNEEYKYMINYILVGGLTLVIPKVKELYPDFSFVFQV
jgi:hypothetical protein